MRAGQAAVVVISFLLLFSVPVSAGLSEPGAPQYANKMLSGFVTPTVAPGKTVHFSFNLTNPYGTAGGWMEGVLLTVGIYKYATREEARDIDSNFSHPPLIDGTSTQKDFDLGYVMAGQTIRMDLDITTSKKTPHGSYFSQSTYFVRFIVAFNFVENSTLVQLQSKGWFTDEQWDEMVSFSGGQSVVNMAYMKSLGVDGLIPDSSFGIKIPIPRWPLALLIGGCGFAAFMSLYYFVLENPGKYPKLEQRFYYLRGKLSEFRSKLQDRRRK